MFSRVATATATQDYLIVCERMGYAPPNGTRSWVEANLIEICRRVLMYMAELVKKIQVDHSFVHYDG